MKFMNSCHRNRNEYFMKVYTISLIVSFCNALLMNK